MSHYEPPTPAECRATMIPDQVRGRLWAQRLKRVFGIDIETCPACGGAVKVIACIGREPRQGPGLPGGWEGGDKWRKHRQVLDDIRGIRSALRMIGR